MEQEEIAQAETSRIEARLLKWMLAASAAVVFTVSVAGHLRLAAGFAGGAAISILGAVWLEQAVSGALRGVADNSAQFMTKELVFKLIIRYPLLLGALYLFYRTKWLPAWAVLAGLFIPLAGGVVECLYQLGGMLFPSLTRRGQGIENRE
ncbi:MAG: ATP synthase subunit I [Terriglobia bacterium]